MTPNRTAANFAVATMALPVVFGACLCFLRPEASWAWVTVMLIVPVSWLGIKAAGDRLGPVGTIVFPRSVTAGAMIFASLLLAVSLGAPLAAALGLIDTSLAHLIGSRGVYVLAGCYFILRGNRLPKVLTPLADVQCDPATMQTVQRRTGWAYVLAGITLAVLWLVLPVHLAQPIGITVVVAGILVPTFIMRAYAKRRTALPNR